MYLKTFIAVIFFILAVNLQAQLDRTKIPAPGPAPEIELGEYTKFTLENGLKVIVVENHKLPRVTFSLLLDIDPVLEKDTAGYVSASGELLRTGTRTRSKDQLDKEIDFIGARLSTSSTGANASSLKKHTGKLLELLADVVINSDFKQAELDKIKIRMQSDLAQSKDDPGTIAGRVSDIVRFGTDHPYGEHMTEESVEKISLEQCRKYYTTYFKPNAAYLAVVGDITEDEVRPLLEKYFGDWQRGDTPSHKYPVPEPPSKTRVIFVDRSNSVQSVINITYPVQIKTGDPDEISANLMNIILGGGEFRLYNNLREKHAFTYGAYSSLMKDKFIGNFTASSEVRNQVTDSAITEILYEMKRIREETVPSEELQTAKNYITGNFAISLEQPQTIARFALNIERYNLPEDYYANYLRNVAAVTSDDVKKAAQKYILPGQAYIVVVGNKDQVADKLSAFGEVSYRNIYGKEISETTEDLGGLTGHDIINKYISAIGGKENLGQIRDRKTVLEGNIQGMSVKMTSYQKAPNLFRQEVSAGGMEQVILFDGTKGIFLIGDSRKEVAGSELEKLSIESKINLLLDLEKEGIGVNLIGKEDINGINAYKVEMKFPSGTEWIQYYDPANGLKIKEIKPVSSAQGLYNQETYYEDYREVSGIKYPYRLLQSLGQQKIEMNVSSVEINTGISDELFKIK